MPDINLCRHLETSNTFPESGNFIRVASWTFLTNHARVLLCVAHDPGVRLRDVAASLDITERSAFGIITDLAEAGYVVKEKDGRRNRYHIQATSRCQNQTAGNAPSVRSWPSWPAPARDQSSRDQSRETRRRTRGDSGPRLD